jgi:hypothetical protein
MTMLHKPIRYAKSSVGVRRVTGFAMVALLLGSSVAAGGGPSVSFYINPAAFEMAIGEAGGAGETETFEQMLVPPGTGVPLDDPLSIENLQGVFPAGDFIDDLTFQSNVDGPGMAGPNPRGVSGLFAFAEGFQGIAPNAGVTLNFGVDGLDIICGPPAGSDHIAISMVPTTNFGSGAVDVAVFDKDGHLIGTATGVPGPLDGSGFLGIIVEGGGTVGRVNLYDPASPGGLAFEAVYEVTAYEASPCVADLDGDGNVGITDFLALLAAWGTDPGGPPDFDGDGNVGITDFLELLANWGPCP